MTGEVNFSGKIAKKIKLEDITVQDMSAEKKEKLDAIFDTKHDGDSKDALTVDELTKSVAEIDTNKDGKLSDAEMTAAWEALDNSKKQGIEKTDYVAYLKAMAAKNVEKATGDNIGNGYTIQLGEQLDDLVERVLASQGVAKDSEGYQDKFNKCKQFIIDNNPQAFNNDKGWLLAGAKVYLPTDTTTSKGKKDVRDLDNKSEVEELYRKWRNKEFGNFVYHVDTQGNRSGASGVDYTNVDGRKSVSKLAAQDVVDFDKLSYNDGKKEEVDAKINAAIEAINSLTDSDSIEGTPVREGDYVEVKLKDGSRIKIKYGKDEGKTITDIYYYPKDSQSVSVTFDHNNKIFVAGLKNGYSSGGVKNWADLCSNIEASVEAKIEKDKYDNEHLVDFDAVLTDEKLGTYKDKKTVIQDKIQKANAVLGKLKAGNEVKEQKVIQLYSGSYRVDVTFNDGSTAKISYNEKGEFQNIQISFKDAKTTDVGYYSNGNLDIDMDDTNNKWEVKLKEAIDVDTIKSYIPSSISDKVKQEVENRNTVTSEFYTADVVGNHGNKYCTKMKYYGDNNSISLDGGVVVGPSGVLDKDIKFTISGKDYCFKKEHDVMDHTYDFYDLLGYRGNENDYLINPSTGNFNYNWSGFNDGNKLYFSGDGALNGATLVRYKNKVALAVKSSDNSVTYYDMNEYMHGRHVEL